MLLSRLRGRLTATSRVMATSCAAAGLYAAMLGASGAVAQDASPTGTPESSATPAQTQQAQGEPSSTSTSTPESYGADESATAEPSTSPAGSPDGSPTAVPEATVLSSPTSTATADAEAGETLDFDKSVEVGDFTLDLDDKDARDAHPGARDRLPVCTDEQTAAKEEAAKKAKTTTSKLSTSDSDSDCRPATEKDHDSDLRNADGTPTLDNPTFSLAIPGAAPIGVPNFFIEKFRIPPFLLPIYQAAGIQYGVRWEVLAAINEIETDYGRNLNVSSAGALGWMQFMPATWEMYGVDANKDGLKDPFNPVDAIFAAARYLRAAGAETDLSKAIFAYNHADWYVDSVLVRARMIGGLPSNFVGSLTGLTQARFPVHAKARYAGDLSERDARKRTKKGQNAAIPVESEAGRRGIKVFSKRGAPVVAVNDGRIVKVGQSQRLGRFVQLQDVYGNVFTYAKLAKVAKTYPAPRERSVSREQIIKELKLPKSDPKPTAAASAGSNRRVKRSAPAKTRIRANGTPAAAGPSKRSQATPNPLDQAAAKERLFAHPERAAARAAGGELQLAEASYKPAKGAPLQLSSRDYTAKPLKKGARVIAGTILGRIGKTSEQTAPHVLFEIRPAGRGAPRIDPKPILDGWKLLESTEIYRAAGRNPFFGPDAETPSIGQILLMSKEALVRQVLANPRIEIYGCGRRDVRLGAIDRRVLATLEFLAASGLKPTVTSLRCGHGFYTAGGNVSHHSSGNAVDIAAINGIPIFGHQGEGSVTEIAVQRLLTLQGTMKPDQIITLMKFKGAENTFAMGDHHDHIHVGWRPMYGTNSKAAKQVNAVLKPKQWIKLIDRLREIDNPTVRQGPSKYAVEVDGDERKTAAEKAVEDASDAHRGE